MAATGEHEVLDGLSGSGGGVYLPWGRSPGLFTLIIFNDASTSGDNIGS